MPYTIYLILLILTRKTIEQSSNYTFGPNLVVNSKFTTVSIPPGYYFYTFPLGIFGWNCTQYCQVSTYDLACQYFNIPCEGSHDLLIDINSHGIYQNFSQNIIISKAGYYLLSVVWGEPFKDPLGKTFGIFINSTLITRIIVRNQTVPYSSHTFYLELYIPFGQINLAFKMIDLPLTDWQGIIIFEVQLRQLMILQQKQNDDKNGSDIQNKIINKIILLIFGNEAVSFINKIPGNRIFMSWLSGFMRSFDRLQLYYYHHHQNLSSYSELLLSNLNSFMNQKEILNKYLLQQCNSSNYICSKVINSYNFILNQLNQKYNYTDSDFLSKNQNGMGFFINNLDLFFFQIPLLLLIYLFLLILFKILFNYKVSIYLRQYSFYGILLFLVFQGNVESLTFYFFAECKTFFSSSIIHKVANIFLVYFFFILMFCVFGSLIWFKFHYKKKIKYFVEGFKVQSVYSVLLQSSQKSIFPFIYGSVHVFLINDLLKQTIILSMVQLYYIVVRVISLNYYLSKKPVYIRITILTSILRLIFIVSFYVYSQVEVFSSINSIHFVTVLLYMLSAVTETLASLIKLVYQNLRDCKSSYLNNKIIHQTTEINEEIYIVVKEQKKIKNNKQELGICQQHKKDGELVFVQGDKIKNKQKKEQKNNIILISQIENNRIEHIKIKQQVSNQLIDIKRDHMKKKKKVNFQKHQEINHRKMKISLLMNLSVQQKPEYVNQFSNNKGGLTNNIRFIKNKKNNKIRQQQTQIIEL